MKFMQAMSMCLLLALFVAGCGDSPSGTSDGGTLYPDELIEANNRGVGLMGSFDYDGAWEVFHELVGDTSISASNQSGDRPVEQAGPDDENDFMDILGVAKNRRNLRALYVSAILSGYMGEIDRSNERFRLVADTDPQDAFAAYYTGQGYAQAGQHEDAMRWFERSMELDPYLRSAIYGAAQASRRVGREDEAERARMFQSMADNPRAHLAEISTNGSQAEVGVVIGNPHS